MADDEEAGSLDEAQAGAGDVSEVALTPVDTHKLLDPPKYEIRPTLGDKFESEAVREIILTSMQEQLMGRQYRSDQAPRWSKIIANGVRQRVQELGMKRYKILVQTTIVEMKGAGIKCGQRCIWDPETDDYITDLYRNDTLFCHTTVYGVYMY